LEGAGAALEVLRWQARACLAAALALVAWDGGGSCYQLGGGSCYQLDVAMSQKRGGSREDGGRVAGWRIWELAADA
jgi:hypothetical protein